MFQVKDGVVNITPCGTGKSNFDLLMLQHCISNNIPYNLIMFDTEGKWDSSKYMEKINGN